jgi:hypothetical protein
LAETLGVSEHITIHGRLAEREDEMSDTPRTDAAACDGTTVPADFAADLERELNEAKAEVEALREAAKQALERLALYYGGNGFAADAEVIKVLHAALKEPK